MRTQRWVVGLVLSFLLAGAAGAATENRGAQTVVRDAAQIDAIMGALEDSVWVADGAQADKQVYVIFSTECGYCQKLFYDSRGKVSNVQFRWIAHCCNGSGAEAIVESRGVDAIANAYARKVQAASNPERAARAMVVNQWASQAVSGNLIYPMLIYRTANGVVVNYGLPPDLDAMISTVASRSDRANHQPRSLTQIDKPLMLASAGGMKSYFNSTGKPMAMYAQPDLGSQKVLDIPVDYGYEVVGFANDEWIVVKGLMMSGGRYTPAYIHAPTDIRLARLKFTVRPVRGLVVAQSRPMEIRLHPDLASPVVDRLDAGYQMDKTGEVSLDGKTWAQVQVYTDGTKGYILQ